MKYIVAILFALISLSSFGETLVMRNYSPPVPVVTKKPAIKKIKLLRSNPHRFSAIVIQGMDPTDEVDDEDIVPQQRVRSQLEEEIDDELPERVRMRLFIARTLALKKYLEAQQKIV